MTALLLVGLLGLSACNSVESLSFPTPPPTTAATGSTTVPPANFTSSKEPPVAGDTTTTSIAIGPGNFTIGGTVVGPNGPVSGATVQADRLVGDAVASTQAVTGPDGSFSIDHILGGRYRVRAWLAPTLALTTPQIFFLGSSATQTTSLTLSSFSGTTVSSAVNPSRVPVGQPANLAVQVVSERVSSTGVVIYTPLPGVAISLVNGPDWGLLSPDSVATGANGEAVFEIECQVVGSPGLAASVSGVGIQAVNVPACDEPITTTTTTTTPESGSGGFGSGGFGSGGSGAGGSNSTSTTAGTATPGSP